MTPARRIAGAAVGIALLVAGWTFVLPPSLGGRTTYLTTSGISMQPYLHTGDLVMLRHQGSYRVGDVVAYHSDTINATVLHRIISIDAAGITTKGDNNSWVDLDHPSTAQVVGKLVHKFGGAGKGVGALRSGPVRAIGAVLLFLAAASALRGRKERSTARTTVSGSRQPRPGQRSVRPDLSHLPHPKLPRGKAAVPYLTGALAVASSAAILVGFTHPVGGAGSRETIYSLHGSYGYSAAAGPSGGLIYGDGQVSTGDPVYLNLVDDLFVTFTTNWESPARYRGDGTLRLSASINGKSGWTHPLDLGPAVTFSDGNGRATAVLDLHAVRDVVREVQQLTRVSDTTYTLTIDAKVHLDGTVGGSSFRTDFPSQLVFSGDGQMLKVAPAASSGPKGTTNAAVAQGLSTSSGGSVTLPPQGPAKIAAFGLGVGVATLRIVGVGGLALALLGGSLQLLARRRAVEHDFPRLVARYRRLLVPVMGYGPSVVNGNVIDVPDLPSLARIAENSEALILHQSRADGDVFVVNNGTAAYRFVAGPSETVGSDERQRPGDLPTDGFAEAGR